MKAAAIVLGAALLLAGAPIAIGCGEKSEPSLADREGEEAGGEAGLSEEERESRERSRAAKQIPAVDRAAYYQVATSSGLIRSRAVVILRGGPSPPRAGRDDLRAARQRLTGLRPRNPMLRRLLRELGPGLRLALREPLDRGVARRVIAISDRLNAGLKRYVHEEPAASVLVPD